MGPGCARLHGLPNVWEQVGRTAMTRTADITRSALRLATAARPMGERGTRLLSFALPISPVALPVHVGGNAGVTVSPLCSGFNPLSSKAKGVGHEAWPRYQSPRDAR